MIGVAIKEGDSNLIPRSLEGSRPLDEVLRDQMKEAHALYKGAIAESLRLKMVSLDVGKSSDGRLALRQSLDNEAVHLHNYIKALRRFSAYNLSRRIPEDI